MRLVVSACCAALVCSQPATAAQKAQRLRLVSIVGIALGANERVAGLNLGLANLRIVQICHTPPGWVLTVSKGGGPAAGSIDAGSASANEALGPKGLRQLRALFLARLSRGTSPRLTGVLDIESPGEGAEITRRTLHPRNFLWRTAKACPVAISAKS